MGERDEHSDHRGQGVGGVAVAGRGGQGESQGQRVEVGQARPAHGQPGDGEGRLWAQMRIHAVRNAIMAELGASSKLVAEWAFFSFLREEGRKAAQAFLDEHAMDLGKRSTLDIDILLEGV